MASNSTVATLLAAAAVATYAYVWARNTTLSVIFPGASIPRDTKLHVPNHMNQWDTTNIRQHTTAESPSIAWTYFPKRATETAVRPIIILCGGNGMTTATSAAKFLIDMRDLDADLVMLDYAGYGKSKGTATITTVVNSAYEVLQDVHAKFPSAPIILWGLSIGGGVASSVAAMAHDADISVAALVLCNTFTSLADVPTLPLRILLGVMCVGEMPTLELLTTKIRCPTLVLHAQHDELFSPITHGKRLFDAVQHSSKEFIVMPGGHNTYNLTPIHIQRVQTFIQNACAST